MTGSALVATRRTCSSARQAIEAGAQVEMPVREMFFGERDGVVRDPFGHRWSLSTAREELTPDDIDGIRSMLTTLASAS